MEKHWSKFYDDANQALEQKHWAKAEDLFKQTLLLLPDHGSAHHLLGKAQRELGRLESALYSQQMSCTYDPLLGWNWFEAGEIQMLLKHYREAEQAFERAWVTLPAEDWIQQQLMEARAHQELAFEPFHNGNNNLSYPYWIRHHEPALPSRITSVSQPFWLLTSDQHGAAQWQILPSGAPTEAPKAPLGDSPWPIDGWLVLLGSDHNLRDGALQAMERWLSNDCVEADLVYADEDQITTQGKRSNPWFKPGWVEESFWSSPWLHGLSLWRINWLRHQCLPLPSTDLAERFAWMINALNYDPKIKHCPLILSHQNSMRKQPNEKLERCAIALKKQLQQNNETIESVTTIPEEPGCFQLQWAIPASIRCCAIIPTRDRADLLQTCLSSLWKTTEIARKRGIDLVITILDNGSKAHETFALLEEWQQKLPKSFKVISRDQPFNWSLLNNIGAATTDADLLLLLNNDVEAIQTGWLEAMAAQAARPKVGCVGALLLYPDNSIQHAGIVVGMNGNTEHAYRNLPRMNNIHHGRSHLLTGWEAVTGACMMIRKSLLEHVGGFDEALPVEFNDVDLCLRLGELGFRHVIPPEAVLMHHESQSRSPHQSNTMQAALQRVKKRWPMNFASTGSWWPSQSDPNHPDGKLRSNH
ncbi:MAG TPA: glycosyltransferase [Prochlorococcaceae cyanobacterium Fu_MAG_50]|nr:glycosyltransferase [Prochlorococcaceae cyanobacterium Fu_MAG_50]